MLQICTDVFVVCEDMTWVFLFDVSNWKNMSRKKGSEGQCVRDLERVTRGVISRKGGSGRTDGNLWG